MRIEDREDFADLVAQAVIDRIEESDRIDGPVNMVVAKVIELQRREAEAKASPANGAAPHDETLDHDSAPPVTTKETVSVGTTD